MACEEGLFCMTLIVVHCNDIDSYIGGNIQSVSLLSVLMKVYAIPCYNRGHINVMLYFTELQLFFAHSAQFI